MAQHLAHALGAMGMQVVIGAIFGFPLISTGIFIAGLVAVLIDLDCVETARRKIHTPFAHSIMSAALIVYAVSFALYLLHLFAGVAKAAWLEGLLSLASGFASHLFIDSLTEDGIYTFPSNLKPRSWLMSRSGEWRAWGRFSFTENAIRKRKEEDQLLNVTICVFCLILIFIVIAVS